MSQLLGRQDCVESLRKDLVDLQGAILDVFSRTGPVRFSSWKFPDKLSCNLDMAALLEQYDFVDGEDAFNQHSHVVLLELVIDRLLLLLQSFSAYVEQIRWSQRREQTQHKGCLSAGLIVRNYWSHLVEFASPKRASKACGETARVSSASHQESSKTNFHRHCWSAPSSTSSFECSPQDHVPNRTSTRCPKADSHSVSCQTVESSLVPCDACHRVQSMLRKTGGALVELFRSEGLPSSLQPLLVVVEDTLELGHMTAADVAQWANEQLRDMRRLAKHLQDVRGSVQPLTERLGAAETEREKLRSQLEGVQKEFKHEREKQQVNAVQLEFSLRKAQRSVKETEQRLKDEQQRFKRETLCWEESHSRLKEKEAVQQDTLKILEYERSELQERVRTLHKEQEACCKLQERIQHLESQISETQLCLDKENAKYHSACRQQESMQAKQTSLLKRVDALDNECEELRRQLGESEERQIDLHSELQHTAEQREQVQAQLAQQQELCLELQKEKQTLEVHVGELKNNVAELREYVQALRQRERLLVAFPELSPLAHTQPQSTGSVLLDMEQQLQANNIRIKVLEQENTTLHSSLVKLRERAQSNATREAASQETWSLSQPSTPAEEQQNHLAQMQMSPLQSSSAAQLAYGNRGKEMRRGESGLESARSGDRVSIAAASPAGASPSSLQLHLQTLHLSSGSPAAKSLTKTRNGSLRSHSKGLNQRKNIIPH